MRYIHEEIKEFLPDYLNGFLSEEERNDIETHLKDCSDCKEEILFISEIRKVDVPDPGDLFWKTLPRKVRGESAQKKERKFSLSSFFRPVPAFVTIMLFAVVITTSVFIVMERGMELDPFFEEPLAYSILDSNGISEDDMPAIIVEWSDDITMEEEIVEDYSLYSYHMEIAYLNQEEFESLFKALKSEERKEG